MRLRARPPGCCFRGHGCYRCLHSERRQRRLGAGRCDHTRIGGDPSVLNRLESELGPQFAGGPRCVTVDRSAEAQYQWLRDLIKRIESAPVTNPALFIAQYEYNGAYAATNSAISTTPAATSAAIQTAA